MGKSNQSKTLLVEIMIAVLAFSLCSMVVLRTFVVTRNQSRLAGVYNDALTDAQNIASKLYVLGDFEASLESEGFQRVEQGWTVDREEYRLQVTASEEETAAGKLLTAEISAYQPETDEALMTLPSVRYVPGEVQP